jgi:hypothetical protein
VVLVFTIRIFGDFSFITYGDQKKFNTILGIGGIVTILKNYVQIESTGPLRILEDLLIMDYMNTVMGKFIETL